MTKYFQNCPRCGSRVKNRTIYQCRKCASYYCLESGWISTSGCGKGGVCPECKEKASTSTGKNRVAGYIR